MTIINFLRKYLCCGKNILCKKTFGKYKFNPYLYSRMGYFLIFLLILLYSTFEISSETIILPFEKIINCQQISEDSTYNCLEISSFYRLSFSSIIIHLICCISSLTKNSLFKKITQTELWPLKFIILSGIYFSSFFIPNFIFGYLAFFSKFLSVFYLIYELILVIYFAHILNITLINGFDKYENNTIYKWSIICFTLLFFLTSICFIVLSIFNYKSNFLNICLICINLILGGINIIISISDLVKDKRFLTSLCIFSYSCYTTWAAINSRPYDKKNESKNERLYLDYTEVTFGLIYVIMALIFISFFSKRNLNKNSANSATILGLNNNNLNNNTNDDTIGINSILIDNHNKDSFGEINYETNKYSENEDKESLILEGCHILVNKYNFEYSEGIGY